MSTGLQELRDDELDEALERVLLPQLAEVISHREPGHCLRVADLSAGLATRLCRRLRSASATPHCYVLAANGIGAAVPADVAVVPPTMSDFSQTTTRSPSSVPTRAAVIPATPAPMIRRSVSPSQLRSSDKGM